MIYRKIILIFLFLFLNNKIFAEIKIIVSIEDEIITNHDINKEINYLKVINPDLDKLKVNQLEQIAKNVLINQIIKKKELSKYFVLDDDNEEIKKYLKNIIARLGFDNKEIFLDLLNKKNSYGLNEIQTKFKIDFLWNEFIYNKYINQVKINKEKILDIVNNLENEQKKEYLLSEIVVKKKKDLLIEKYFEEINTAIDDIGFSNAASIYSISESSKFGGKLDWIDQDSLFSSIKKDIEMLKVGDVTKFIPIDNNYIILKIEDIRISKFELDKEKEIKNITNQEINQKLSKYSQIYFYKTKLNYFINEK